MGEINSKKKFLNPQQVNFLQGLAKMRGHDSDTLAEATRFPRSTIISNMNGRRRNPLARWAIATILQEPVETLFPSGEMNHGI